MDKVMLVIDKPESCDECPCHTYSNLMVWCAPTKYDAEWIRANGLCPLKQIPKEEDIYEVGMNEEDTRAKQQWNKGWNACIDAITGETE